MTLHVLSEKFPTFARWVRPTAQKIRGVSAAVSKKYDRLYRRFVPSATILLYHRVEDVTSDPHRLCVSRKNFEEHMRYISEKYRIISLSALVKELKDGILKKHTFAVTFDDGYRDNLTHALPVLEKYNIPATIFVVAGPIISGQFFWEKKISGYIPGQPLTKDDLVSLTNNPLIEIGAHTMSHPHLSRQSDAQQKQQLEESKKILQEIIGKPIESFAYPFGGKNDFNEESVRLARASYASAYVNVYGMAKTRTDIFRLPRVNIRDWDIKTFKKEL